MRKHTGCPGEGADEGQPGACVRGQPEYMYARRRATIALHSLALKYHAVRVNLYDVRITVRPASRGGFEDAL